MSHPASDIEPSYDRKKDADSHGQTINLEAENVLVIFLIVTATKYRSTTAPTK